MGCSGPWGFQPAPLAATPVAIHLSHFVGSPLSGPTDEPPQSYQAQDALVLHWRVIALTKLPEGAMQPLGSQAKLIAVEHGGVPVLQAPRLTGAAQIVPLANADGFCQTLLDDHDHPARLLARLHSTLLGGVTATLNADEQFPQPRVVAGQTVRRSVQLDVYRPRDAAQGQPSLQAALVIEDLVRPALPGAAESAETPGAANAPAAAKPLAAPVMQREMSLFDPPAGNAFAIVVPMQFDGSAAAAVAFVVEIHAGRNSPQNEQDLGRSLAQIALRDAQAPLLSPMRSNPDWAALIWALDALQKPSPKRRDLFFLADQTGASACRDLVLIADDAVLENLAQRIVQQVHAAAALNTKEALGWLLEKAAYRWMCQTLSAHQLPPELAATLTLHTGEAGRHAGSVDDALRQATGFKDFQTRIGGGKSDFSGRLFPAARVRAFDFLQSHGQALPGTTRWVPPRNAPPRWTKCSMPQRPEARHEPTRSTQSPHGSFAPLRGQRRQTQTFAQAALDAAIENHRDSHQRAGDRACPLPRRSCFPSSFATPPPAGA